LFLPTPLFFLLKSFLSNRKFSVRCKDEISDPHPIKAGVFQGSILSPTLYNIYTADLPQSINTALAAFAATIISTNSEIVIAVNYKIGSHYKKSKLTKTNPLMSPLPSGLKQSPRFI
jgi:uncharacterized membrane-anchored protein